MSQSIYTAKLARRGHDIPDSLQANFYHLKQTREIMEKRFISVPADDTFEDFIKVLAHRPDVSCFLVEGKEGIIGFMTRNQDLSQAHNSARLGELADPRYIQLPANTPLLTVMNQMRNAGAHLCVITDKEAAEAGRGICGLITSEQIARAVIEGMEFYSQPA